METSGYTCCYVALGSNWYIQKTAMSIVPTKMINTIATNFASTASINFHSKKVRDCYILHAVLLVIILQYLIIIIYYYYAKQKGIKYTNNMEWKILNFKKFVLKIVRVIISMT